MSLTQDLCSCGSGSFNSESFEEAFIVCVRSRSSGTAGYATGLVFDHGFAAAPWMRLPPVQTVLCVLASTRAGVPAGD